MGKLFSSLSISLDGFNTVGGYQGNDVGGEFRAALVLVERNGRWLLAGWHASPIAGRLRS